MKYKKGTLVLFISMLILEITTITACGFLGIGNTASWKEEVLLHDGTIIIVERIFRLGGKRTLDSREQRNLDESVSFVLPGSNKKVIWKTDFRDEKPEPNSLDLLALDIVNGTPYIATMPRGCISYNKWQRPNPPYIFFKYDGNDWRRISLTEFPTEIRKVNVIISRPPAELLKPFYTVAQVKEQNRDLPNEEYKTIVRRPIKIWCEEMIYDGTYWRGIEIDFFEKQPSYEACLSVCKQERFSAEYCPCNRLFKHNTKGE